MHHIDRLAFVLVLPLLLPACEAGGGMTRGRDGGGGGEEMGEARCHDGRDDDGDGWIDCEDPGCFALASCGPGDGGPRRDAGFMGCVGTPYEAVEAYAPIDIVWVVDTSGSMRNEAERVQENMQRFATADRAVMRRIGPRLAGVALKVPALHRRLITRTAGLFDLKP